MLKFKFWTLKSRSFYQNFRFQSRRDDSNRVPTLYQVEMWTSEEHSGHCSWTCKWITWSDPHCELRQTSCLKQLEQPLRPETELGWKLIAVFARPMTFSARLPNLKANPQRPHTMWTVGSFCGSLLLIWQWAWPISVWLPGDLSMPPVSPPQLWSTR